MLSRIILKNFKSNLKNYILFFVSNIIAVAELFVFWALNDVVLRAVTDSSIVMEIKSDFMIAVSLVTVITVLLMVFSMKYYIKLRAKDYSTFIMLGMKKKMSYLLLFAEYGIGCISSLVIGLLSGSVFLYGLLCVLHRLDPGRIAVAFADWRIYRNTAGLSAGIMLGIFVILLVWMDGRDLSTLMMKEEVKEKRPVSPKWLLFTALGIGLEVLAVKQYYPGTWGYYISHVEFVAGGFLMIAFGGGFVLEWLKKRRYYLHYVFKINQLDSKYQSNMMVILMLFAVHFFALSYISTQIAQALPLNKDKGNYPYDTIWTAQQKDEKFSEKTAEKYGGTVSHIPMIRATLFYSQEHIGTSESTYRKLTGKSYGLKDREIVVGIEVQNFKEEEVIKDKQLSELFEWLYIGKYPGEGSFWINMFYDPQYQYEVKEIHTQNLFGKFTPGEAGEEGEDVIIFSDEYFKEQWANQAADQEQPSVLELFSFPEETKDAAWKEIKAYADENGVEVIQPDMYHTQHAVCYNKDIFLREQKMSTLFLLSSKLFILITIFVSGIFIMIVKNLSELSSYARRYRFLRCMGMKERQRKKSIAFEVRLLYWISAGAALLMAVVYMLSFVYRESIYRVEGVTGGNAATRVFHKISEGMDAVFLRNWLLIIVVYVAVNSVIQSLFAGYVARRAE